MVDSWSFGNEDISENTLLIGEENEKQIGYLEATTDQYMDAIRDIERRCLKTGNDPDIIMQDLTVLNESMLQVCEQFEKIVNNKAAINAARAAFRDKTDPILSKSYGALRIRTWPRGYQGDFQTLEFLYRNTPMSDGIGYYLDKYMLSSVLAVGVRERMHMLAELLKTELSRKRPLSILDIACGSCREIHEIIPEIEKSQAHITCIDLDSEALDFAHNRLSYAGLSSEQVDFMQFNALRLFDLESALPVVGTRDVIYSVGYFDYLSDDFLIKMLNSLYNMLNPHGRLIVALKDANRYRPQMYHWFAHWDGFLQRTPEQFERIFQQAEIPDNTISMSRVKSGSIVFYLVTKE